MAYVYKQFDGYTNTYKVYEDGFTYKVYDGYLDPESTSSSSYSSDSSYSSESTASSYSSESTASSYSSYSSESSESSASSEGIVEPLFISAVQDIYFDISDGSQVTVDNENNFIYGKTNNVLTDTGIKWRIGLYDGESNASIDGNADYYMAIASELGSAGTMFFQSYTAQFGNGVHDPANGILECTMDTHWDYVPPYLAWLTLWTRSEGQEWKLLGQAQVNLVDTV